MKSDFVFCVEVVAAQPAAISAIDKKSAFKYRSLVDSVG
jgi:hypothetical protein